MNYETFYIGNNQTLVSYEDGNMEILSGEELTSLAKNSQITNIESEFNSSNKEFNKTLIKFMKEYIDWKEAGLSQVNERVEVRIIHEKMRWSSSGVDYQGEYEVIGDDSQVSQGTHTVEVKSMLPAWKNVNLIYRSLLQLWYSGCYATLQDEKVFKEAMNKRH